MNIDPIVETIIDPMGKHWNQPNSFNWDFTLTHVTMPNKDFEQLRDYSRSMPSGVYVGKMWKRHEKDCWYLMWYGDHENPSKVSIKHRVILLQSLIDLIDDKRTPP